MNLLILCSSLFLFSFFLTYIVRLWALKKSIIDFPNERSSHSVPTPRGGGIAIVIIWFVVINFLFLRKEINSSLFYSLLCGFPISIIGLLDDVMTISTKVRFSIQIISAIIAVYFLGGIKSIDFGFEVIEVHTVFSLIAVIGIVWFTNLFNFLDGVDGYLSAEIIFIGLSVFILFDLASPALLASITAGFLIWNWQPAKIFMGDVGSTLLGFTIGVFAIHYQNTNQISIIILLMLTSVFWFDATLTLFRRLIRREKLAKAHKKHAYQRMVQSGFSHKKTVIYSQLLNIPVLALVVLSLKLPNFLLLLFLINILYLYFVSMIIDRRYPFA